MNCPSHFPFLKLTHWNKWVFTLSWGQGVIPLHFLSTPWMCCALYTAVKIIWIDWTLTFCSCCLWCKCLTAGDSKGHYFQSILTCFLHLWRHSGVQIGYGAITCHVTIWKMTFYQGHLLLWILGEHPQQTGQLFLGSTRAAGCLRWHTCCSPPFSFHPASFCVFLF